MQEKGRGTGKKLMGQGGDPLAWVAHHALQKHRILPSEFLAMSQQEQAFIVASDHFEMEGQRKAMGRLKVKKRRRW